MQAFIEDQTHTRPLSSTALVPLNNAAALPQLAQAGVKEIYVGFHDDAWDNRFESSELNRMSGFGSEANPFDFETMCEHIERASQLGMHAYVCFNASSYTRDELNFIASRYLPGIARSHARGIIMSNQSLIDAGREAGLQTVISTVAGVFNERLVAYYRRLGAGRIILPRDLSIFEIESIVQAAPELEYEVFLMRNGCMFSDSHCLGKHCSGKPSLCSSLRSGTWTIDSTEASREAYGAEDDEVFLEHTRYTEWLLNTHYHRRTCGLCALWRFEQLGIAAYKVVGRGDDVDDLVADAKLVMDNLQIARASATEEEYLANMLLPREPETLCGMNGLSCYYPEISRRWPRESSS